MIRIGHIIKESDKKDIMKTIKNIFYTITIIVVFLELTQIIPSNIANPIFLVSLSSVILVKGLELKANNNRNGFILMLIIALFTYAVVLYYTLFR